MTAGGGAGARGFTATARLACVADNISGGLSALLRPRYPLRANFVPAWRRHGAAVALAVGAAAASVMWLDASAFARASRLPAWLVDGAYQISDLGLSGWILVPSGALVVFIALFASPALDTMSRAVLAMTVTRIGYVFIAVGLPGLVGTVAKRLIGRVRPSVRGPFAYEPLSWRPDFASFPSGHTTTAFAALVALGIVFPRARLVLCVYALLIAASRVVVSAHYPSDVIAGAALGTWGALWVRDWFAARRLAFYVGSDGRGHLMPGPSLRRIRRVAGALLAH